jgi:hypothetical protein
MRAASSGLGCDEPVATPPGDDGIAEREPSARQLTVALRRDQSERPDFAGETILSDPVAPVPDAG